MNVTSHQKLSGQKAKYSPKFPVINIAERLAVATSIVTAIGLATSSVLAQENSQPQTPSEAPLIDFSSASIYFAWQNTATSTSHETHSIVGNFALRKPKFYPWFLDQPTASLAFHTINTDGIAPTLTISQSATFPLAEFFKFKLYSTITSALSAQLIFTNFDDKATQDTDFTSFINNSAALTLEKPFGLNTYARLSVVIGERNIFAPLEFKGDVACETDSEGNEVCENFARTSNELYFGPAFEARKENVACGGYSFLYPTDRSMGNDDHLKAFENMDKKPLAWFGQVYCTVFLP